MGTFFAFKKSQPVRVVIYATRSVAQLRAHQKLNLLLFVGLDSHIVNVKFCIRRFPENARAADLVWQ